MISAPNPLRLLNGNKYFGLLCGLLMLISCSARKKSAPDAERALVISRKPVVAKSTHADSARLQAARIDAAIPVISLMLPFKLDGINADNRGDIESAYLPLDFYQGFRLALDSVADGGKKLKLNVVDSRDDSSQVRALVRGGKLDRSSLVVGPVFPAEIAEIAGFAARTHTYFISPLSPRPLSDFKNPYLVMINSPLDAYAGRTAEFINEHYAGQRVVVIRATEADDRFIRPLIAGLKTAPELVRINAAYKLAFMKGRTDAVNPVILVVPSLDKALWSNLMVYLAGLTATQPLVVFAHPNFEHLRFTNYDLMQQIGLRYSSTYFVDKSNTRMQDFIHAYRAAYQTEPGRYAVIGFDIGTCFGNVVAAGGKAEDALDNPVFRGLHNEFKFKKVPGQGYWNSSIMMLKYSQGQLLEDK